jgi:hypothetical protein
MPRQLLGRHAAGFPFDGVECALQVEIHSAFPHVHYNNGFARLAAADCVRRGGS